MRSGVPRKRSTYAIPGPRTIRRGATMTSAMSSPSKTPPTSPMTASFSVLIAPRSRNGPSPSIASRLKYWDCRNRRSRVSRAAPIATDRETGARETEANQRLAHAHAVDLDQLQAGRRSADEGDDGRRPAARRTRARVPRRRRRARRSRNRRAAAGRPAPPSWLLFRRLRLEPLLEEPGVRPVVGDLSERVVDRLRAGPGSSCSQRTHTPPASGGSVRRGCPSGSRGSASPSGSRR